jgi:putative peptidoglycan lipid II flippase
MDAWLVAFKIPNFLRRLFAEGSFSQAFVPVISEYKHKRPHDEVRELVDDVAGTFGVVLFVVTLIGVIAAPLIILAFAPAWRSQPDKWHLATSMLHWTFPYLFFISLSALFSGVLNSYNRFALPAYTQVIMNVVMVITATSIAPHTANPGVTLAMGVFVSGLLQVGFQVPAVMRLGLFRRPRWRPAAEGVRRIGKLMLPGIFGSSVAQVSLLLDSQIATFLITGSVSWLYYATGSWSFRSASSARIGDGHPARAVASPRVAINGAFHAHARLGPAPRDRAGLAAAVAMLVFAGTADCEQLAYGNAAHDADVELRADSRVCSASAW